MADLLTYTRARAGHRPRCAPVQIVPMPSHHRVRCGRLPAGACRFDRGHTAGSRGAIWTDPRDDPAAVV
jgi:hypothetical protein